MEGLLLVVFLAIVGGWIAGVVAAFRVGALAGRVRDLERRLAAAGAQEPAPSPPALGEPDIALAPEAPPEPLPPAAGPWTPPPAAAPPDREAPDAGPSEPLPLPEPASLETRLAASWIVWAGGIMVALAAVFFLRHAIDAGWLTEPVRIAIGLLAGAAMVAGGDRLGRRRALREAGAAPSGLPDVVPDALGGAGFFTLYATVWAAHALFGLIGGLAAFVGLAAVALAAMALSLRQGWRIGLIGVLGAFLAPALVASDRPDAAALFGYLAVVSVAGLWIFLGQRAVAVRGALLAGSFLWPALWLSWIGGSAAVTLGYLLAMVLAYALLGRAPREAAAVPGMIPEGTLPDDAAPDGAATPAAPADARPPLSRRIGDRLSRLDLADAALALSGLLVAAHAPWVSTDPGLLWLAAPWVALAMAMALPAFGAREAGPVLAAIGVLALLALWPAPDTEPWLALRALSAPAGTALPDAPRVLWAHRLLWSGAALSAALALSAAGALALGAPRRGLVAAAGVFGPVAAFLLCWLPTDGLLAAFGLVTPPEPVVADAQWAAVALAFSALCAGLALWRLRRPPPLDPAAAVLTAGAVTGLAIAATFLLRDNWLALALAAEVLGIAAAWRMTGYGPLRALAAAVALAMAAAVGLTLAEDGLFEGAARGLVPVLTGWALPGAALWAAAALLLRGPDGAARRLPDWLRAGALTLFALAGVLGLRVVLSGAPFAEAPGRLEQALQTLWAMGAAAVVFRVAGPAARWLGTGFAVLALAQLGLGNLLAANPVLDIFTVPVGGLPVLNLLGLLYLAPAAVLGLARWPAAAAPRPLPRLRLPVAGLLLWVWASLEAIRTASGGLIPMGEGIDEAGLWAVSAAWVLLAAAALALGLMRDRPTPRLYGLGLLALTALKVVFVDLAGLSGLWRVASLLGLGLALLAIGDAYRRFGPARRPAP